jgi:two-component system, chemotaxis family, CheB/CheR fusion protein
LAVRRPKAAPPSGALTWSASGRPPGGLQPLQEFFGNMPQDTGIAFVIVQHLSPEFKSLMSELLSRGHTSMPLHHVEHGMPLECNSIYLIPPKKNVVIFQAKLHLIDQGLTRGHLPNFPIDMFFHSLAEKLNERADKIDAKGGSGTIDAGPGLASGAASEASLRAA